MNETAETPRDVEVRELHEWAIVDLLRRHRRGLRGEEISETIASACELLVEPLGVPWYELPLHACRDELMALLYLESLRWKDGQQCPRCRGGNLVRTMNPWYGEIRGAHGRRAWSWYCHTCFREFNVRIGTVLQHSGTPLSRWCHALWLAATSPQGITRREFADALGVNEQSAASRMLKRLRRVTPSDPLLGKFTGMLRQSLDTDGRSCAAHLRIVA